eukprot:4049934-Pleurochrysis_carterae.AAC.1
MLVCVVRVVKVVELVFQFIVHLHSVVHRGVERQCISILKFLKFQSGPWPHRGSQEGCNAVRVVSHERLL